MVCLETIVLTKQSLMYFTLPGYNTTLWCFASRMRSRFTRQRCNVKLRFTKIDKRSNLITHYPTQSSSEMKLLTNYFTMSHLRLVQFMILTKWYIFSPLSLWLLYDGEAVWSKGESMYYVVEFIIYIGWWSDQMENLWNTNQYQFLFF